MPRWLPALLLAILPAIVFQHCSLGITSALLERQADREALAYARGSGPFDWRFERAHDLTFAPPGLQQVEFGPDGLSAVANASQVVLPLRLAGRRVDTGYADSLLLDIESDRAMQWQLLLGSEIGGIASASRMQTLPAGRSRLRFDARSLPLQQNSWQEAPIAFLQIGLQMEPGQRLKLRQFSLMPADCHLHPDGVRLSCPLPPTRQLAPATRPEQILRQVDSLRSTSPQALLSTPADASQYLVAIAGAAVTPVPAFSAAFLLLGYAAVRRSGRWRSRPRLELFAFIGLPALLLFGGWPMPENPPLLLAAWATWYGAALLLPDPVPASAARLPWQWLGGWPEAIRTSVATLSLLALLLLIAIAAGTDPATGTANASAVGEIGRYFGWALLQQLFLLRFVLPRLGYLHSSSTVQAAVGGLLFGLLHLPNFGLMLLTALGGSVWIALALRSRSLVPLAVSHALLGTAALALLPPFILRSAEIGGRFVFM